MPVIDPEDWLEWHSAQKAQTYAVRLSASSVSVLPSDRNFQKLHEEQILGDLIGLAIHGRRTMERRQLKSATLSPSPLWPYSETSVPGGLNLWDVFGALVHAKRIDVEWEEPQLNPSPYRGRSPKFAGAIQIESKENTYSVPIGSIVAAYFGSVQNQMATNEKKEAS